MANDKQEVPSASKPQTKQKKKPLSTHLIAGGGAGFMEACVCHPLDTIKVRMQLRGKRSVNLFHIKGFSRCLRV
jgi:solute carrier family 25 (mitochondrial citrate transporter), member 1